MNRKQKKMLVRIVISAALLVLVNLLPLPFWLRCAVYAAAYFCVGCARPRWGLKTGRSLTKTF